MITHKSVCESPSSIVLTVCLSSDDQGKKIRSFVKDFSETVGGIEQMAFVYNNKEHLRRFAMDWDWKTAKGRRCRSLKAKSRTGASA